MRLSGPHWTGKATLWGVKLVFLFCGFHHSRFPLVKTHRWVSQAAAHEDGQLRGHGEGLGPWDGVGDDQVGLGGMQGAGAPQGGRAHLLGQQHGPLWQLVGVGAGLLPHRDLLGEEVFALVWRSKVGVRELRSAS